MQSAKAVVLSVCDASRHDFPDSVVDTLPPRCRDLVTHLEHDFVVRVVAQFSVIPLHHADICATITRQIEHQEEWLSPNIDCLKGLRHVKLDVRAQWLERDEAVCDKALQDPGVRKRLDILANTARADEMKMWKSKIDDGTPQHYHS